MAIDYVNLKCSMRMVIHTYENNYKQVNDFWVESGYALLKNNLYDYIENKFRHIKCLIGIILTMLSLSLFAQDTISFTNSYSYIYERDIPSLNYSYIASSLTHCYSGNWDFDGDNICDSVKFIGTGGAHLFYYLQIVLSSDKVKREYTYIETDMPIFDTIDDASDIDKKKILHFFIVYDFDNDGIDEIYLRIDASLKDYLSKYNITSNRVIVDYLNGELNISDYK